MRNRSSPQPLPVERARLPRAGQPLRSRHVTNASSPVCLVTVPIHAVSNLFHYASLPHAHTIILSPPLPRSLNFQLNASIERRDALMSNSIARRLPLVQAILLVPLTILLTLACHPSAHSPPVPIRIVSQIPSSLVAMALGSTPLPFRSQLPLILFTLTISSHSHRLCQPRRLRMILLMNTPPVIVPRQNFFPVRASSPRIVSHPFQPYTRTRSPHMIRALHGMPSRTMSAVIL